MGPPGFPTQGHELSPPRATRIPHLRATSFPHLFADLIAIAMFSPIAVIHQQRGEGWRGLSRDQQHGRLGLCGLLHYVQLRICMYARLLDFLRAWQALLLGTPHKFHITLKVRKLSPTR